MNKTANLVKAVLFGLCALTWLPDWPAERVSGLRIVMPILCTAVSILFLVQYFKSRKTEREANGYPAKNEVDI